MNNNNSTTTATPAGDEADAPNTANRWKIELRNHGSKFFNALDDLITIVDKPDELFKMLHDIGMQHKTYDVKSEHIQVELFIVFALVRFVHLIDVLSSHHRPLLMV
jgi:hemoglobin-like flavoprotein